jgi:hypothetical protein
MKNSKSQIRKVSAFLFLLPTFCFLLSSPAQTSTFTYQGELTDSGSPANGSYDLTFSLFVASSGGSAVAGPLTNTAVAVVGGLFTATLDLGSAAFPGADRWLEIAARTNGPGAFATLTPRQQITSTPYAIRASVASSVSGSLSGDVTGTLSATSVASVGQLAAAAVASGANAANAATSANTASTIVKRDASRNFTAGTITASLSGNATTATTANNFSGSLAGDVTGTQGTTAVASVGGQSAAAVASGASAANAATSANTADTIVKRDASGNFTAGTVTATSFSGSGASLTSLNAGNVSDGTLPTMHGGTGVGASGAAGNYLRSDGANWTSSAIAAADVPNALPDSHLATIATAGKVADTALSANVALLDRTPQTFTGTNIFSGRVAIGSGALAPAAKLDVQGTAMVRGIFTMRATALTPATGGTLAPASSYVQLTPTASVTLSATTAIADGSTAGDTLILHNLSASFTVTVPHGANTKLAGAASRVLGADDTLTLVWDGLDWVQFSASSNH